MPAESKSQQRFFGMVRAYQKGQASHVGPKVRAAAKTISPVSAKHFATTSHSGLPEHVKRAFDHGFFKAAEEVGVDAVTANNIYKFANGSGWAPTMMGAIPGALTGGLAGYLAPSEEESDASLIDPKIRNMLLGGAAGGLGGGLLGNAAGSIGYEHGVRDLLTPQAAQ